MCEGRYNIPKQYKVDKGMPLNVLFQRIENEKCREIFKSGIESVTWNYQITDAEGIADANALIRQKGISVFEIVLKHKISTELLTEVMASLMQKPMVLVCLCEDELAMGTYLPCCKGNTGKTVTTDFYPYDMSRLIEILDFGQDTGKSAEQIHKRIYMTLRQQRKVIMIEKAFQSMQRDKMPRMDLSFEFSMENIARIREEAEYCESRLRVEA